VEVNFLKGLYVKTPNRIMKTVLIAAIFCPALVSAADKTCAAVNKAGELGLKQTRVHYAGDLLSPAVPNSLDKVKSVSEKLMHSITIDKTNYMALDGVAFSTTVMKDADERSLMVGTIVFQAIDEGCRSLGKAVIGGRDAFVYEQGSTTTTADT
jgi:hypothetical protein